MKKSWIFIASCVYCLTTTVYFDASAEDLVPEEVTIDPAPDVPSNESVPEEAPKESVPEEFPKESVPEEFPKESVPKEAPKESVPKEAPKESVPEEFPKESVPEGSPKESVPEEFPKESVPEEAPKESTSDDSSKDLQIYNDGSGKAELDLTDIERLKYKKSKPVISPDKRHMVYSEHTFIPSSHQIISKLIYVPVPRPKMTKIFEKIITVGDAQNNTDANPYNLDNQKLNRHVILSLGFDKDQRDVFKTITILDWSADSNRIIFKERTSIHHKGILETELWVYDLILEKAYKIRGLRSAIKMNIYLDKQIDLDTTNWDISILGWEKGSNDQRVIVDVYVYPAQNKSVSHLGTWSYDIEKKYIKKFQDSEPKPEISTNSFTAK